MFLEAFWFSIISSRKVELFLNLSSRIFDFSRYNLKVTIYCSSFEQSSILSFNLVFKQSSTIFPSLTFTFRLVILSFDFLNFSFVSLNISLAFFNCSLKYLIHSFASLIFFLNYLFSHSALSRSSRANLSSFISTS